MGAVAPVRSALCLSALRVNGQRVLDLPITLDKLL